MLFRSRFGLVGVRGVGRNVAEEIIAERERGGAFSSLHDFVNRVDYKCWNRKTLEALIMGGAFDSTGYTRRQLFYFVDETSLLDDVSRRQRDNDRGQVSMFDLFGDDEESGFKEEVPAADGVEWPLRVKLKNEKDTMGIYVSGHPLDPYEDAVARMSRCSLGDLADAKHDAKVANYVGLISGVNVRLTKRGTKMATFTLEDTTGWVECITFDFEIGRAHV